MASDEPDSAESAESATSGGHRPRPAATIDLTATEIARQAEAPPVSPGETEKMADPVAPLPPWEEPAAPVHPADPPLAAAVDAGPKNGGVATDDPAASDRPAPPPPRRSRGLAAAFVGCVITLVVLAGAWLAGLFEPADNSLLAAKLAALDAQVRAIADRPPASSPATSVTPAAPDTKAIADLNTRLDAVIQALRRLDTIEARLGKVESAPVGTRPAATDPALLERLSATEAALQSIKDGTADLRARIDALAEKAAAPPPPPPAAEVSAQDIAALAARLAALEAAGKALDERVSKASGRTVDTAVRLALVAMELRVAVERGQPFVVELDAARLVVADKSLLAPLDAAAASGVRPPQTLSRELADIAPAMLRAAGTPPHEGGLIDRLQANAERLIRIRPIAEATGTDPTTVIVRAEVKATRGDLAGALAEIVSLPADIKAPAESWIRDVEARLAAVDAARKLAVSALEALGKPMP